MFQVIMPAAFVGLLPPLSAAVLLKCAYAILDGREYSKLYRYMQKDAIAMQLPLLGGQDSVHDWNYLCWNHVGILEHTSEIAGLIRMIGTLCILAAEPGQCISLARKRGKPSSDSRFTHEH